MIDSDFIATFSGGWLHFEAPWTTIAAEVDVVDIATALSREPRYGGHTLRPYFVGEHCVKLCRHARQHGYDAEVQLCMLMHDGSEGYLRDIPGPIKRKLGGMYMTFERNIEQGIAAAFSMLDPWPDVVKEWDKRILADERAQVMRKTNHRWSMLQDDVPALGIKIDCWGSRRTKREFLNEFYRLRPLFEDKRSWWQKLI